MFDFDLQVVLYKQVTSQFSLKINNFAFVCKQKNALQTQ